MSLADAVTLALQQNLTLRQDGAQVVIDRALVAEAKASLWPTVKASGSYTNETVTTTSYPIAITIPGIGVVNGTLSSTNETTPYSFSLTLSYDLYTGNSVQDQIAIEQATLDADEAAYAAEAAQIVLQVREAYYNLWATASAVTAAQQTVNEATENVRVTQLKVTAGTAPMYDLLQAQTSLASDQQTLTQDKASAVTAQYTLNKLLTLPLVTVVTPTTPMGLPQPPQQVDTLVSAALRQRPEIREAQAKIASAQASIDLAKSGLRPTVTISGGPTSSTGGLSALPVSWSGTLGVTLTIFDGGLTKAEIAAAEGQLQQAQLSLQQEQQTVESDVRSAYLSLQQAAEQLRAAQVEQTYAQETLRVANLKYRSGAGTQLDVITAQQNLLSAENAVISATYSYNAALAELDQATGLQVKF